MKVHVYRATDRLALLLRDSVVRAAELAYKAHEGIWLGILSREALTRAVAAGYERSGRYRGSCHNESGFFPWERVAVERAFRRRGRVLVAASGGGREVVALVAEGIAADGFDPSAELVDAARQRVAERGADASITVSAPDEVPASLGVYAGAFIGWGAYSHIVGSEARISFLRQLGAHLEPGSPLLLSVWSRGDGERSWGAVAAIARALGRLGLPGDRVEVGDSCTLGFAHFFTRSELADELARGGFTVEFESDIPCLHVVAKSSGRATCTMERGEA